MPGQRPIPHRRSAGDPAIRCTALGLVLTGRITPDSGSLELDDARSSLETFSALVDSPEISAPLDEIRVRDLVAEELALAAEPPGRGAVREWLREHEFTEVFDLRVESIDGATRTSLLCALALERRGVRLLVLDCPDRFGADLDPWRQIATSYAELDTPLSWSVTVGLSSFSASTPMPSA